MCMYLFSVVRANVANYDNGSNHYEQREEMKRSIAATSGFEL